MEKNFRTIVGGRSSSYQSPNGYPRGIEILLKKAKVDLEFRRFFLQDPAAAAKSIQLDINDTESKILLSTPSRIIEQMVESTFVPKHQVGTFMSARTAAMLAMAIAASVLMPMHVYSTGMTAETAAAIHREESTAALIEQKLKVVQEALEHYRNDHGGYPSTLEWVTGNPLEDYLNPSQLYDPWYRKFHYRGVKDAAGGIGNYWLQSLGVRVESPLDDVHSPIDAAIHKFPGDNPVRIVFPQPEDRIGLPRIDDSPVLFVVEHETPGAALDWYLDNRKIGTTVGEHLLPLPEGITAGGHWLSVIDEAENYGSVSFNVERHHRF
jgi:hypothetical protein